MSFYEHNPELNVANVLRLIEVLKSKKAEKSFDMGVFAYEFKDKHPCGTPACICGFAVATFYPDELKEAAKEALSDYEAWIRESWEVRGTMPHPRIEDRINFRKLGQESLGLSNEQEATLFIHPGRAMTAISREEAIKVLEHLAETGKVDWAAACGWEDED